MHPETREETMSHDRLPELSSRELDVMNLLWRRDALSAREVHEALEPLHGWAYSTTRTILERLVDKGLVEKRSFHGIYLYAAAVSRARGLAARVREFAERVLGADPEPVVSLFAERGNLAPEELAELEELLGGGDRKEGGR